MEDSTFICACALLLIAVLSSIRNRAFLTTSALPDPDLSAWKAQFQSTDDRAWVCVTGFNRNEFNTLLAVFAEEFTINKAGTGGRPTQHTTADALGLVLYWLNSSVKQKTLCQLFGFPPAAVSRILSRGLNALRAALDRLPTAAVEWPSEDDMKRCSDASFAVHQTIRGVWGAVDGLKLRINRPSDPDAQAAYYNGWIHQYGVFLIGSRGGTDCNGCV